MATTHIEIEKKFDLGETEETPSFTALAEVATVDDAVTLELEATYFDTRDLAVTAAGATVRRRTGGADAGWHLKLPTADGRFEVHEPLGRSVHTVPRPLRLILQAITRGEALEPIVTVRTHRTVRRLLDAHEGVLAEVADDRVIAQRPGSEATPRAWRELEIELVDGGVDFLDAASGLLQSQDVAPSSAESKLWRALGDRAPEQPARPDIARADTATGIVHERLNDLVADLRRFDPLVRADAPDSVHRMRVTTRRLRNTLATFRPLLERDITDPLRDELKWIAGVLGEARDAEVLRKRLIRQLDEEPPEMVRGTASQFVDQDLATRYREAHRRCLQSMETERYLALVDRLDQIVAAPLWSRGAQRQGLAFLRKRVRHDYKRLHRAVKNSGRAHDEADYSRRLHEVRKAAKRVRYATEPLIPMRGKKAERFMKAMKRVQSVLGDHQDGAVTRLAVRELSDRATAKGVNAYALGVLDVRQEQHAAEKRSQFGATWDKASRKKLRAWLS